MPDDQGLRRPAREADVQLARDAARIQRQREEAERLAREAEEARTTSERLAAEAQQRKEQADWSTREAELAARDRENARLATEMAEAARGKRSNYTSRTKTPSRPLWVLQSKPRSRGIRRALWWIWSTLGLYKAKWIPQPRVNGTYFGRVLEMGKWIMEHRRETQAVIVVFTTKGGACKTTTATWRSAIRATLTKLALILIDTDSGGGKVLKRFTLDPTKALTTNDLVAKRGAIAYEELSRSTETDPNTGVIVIHSPPGAKFPDDELGKTVLRVQRESHSVVIDCGPGFDNPNTDSVLRCADVIEIPANFQSSDNLDDVQATLDHEPYGLRREGVIERVSVVVSAVRWRHFNYRTQFELARRYGLDPQQIILIPYSRYLQKDGPVDLDRIRPKVRFGYTHLDYRAGQILVEHGRRQLPEGFTEAIAYRADDFEAEEPSSAQETVSVHSAEADQPNATSTATGWVQPTTHVTEIVAPRGGSTNGLVSAQERT